jgi:glutaredoxin 3
MEDKVVIYGKPRCPFCDKAKAVSEMKGFDYEYKLLDADYTQEEFFEQFPTARTFPQIVVGETHVGGYTEFAKFLSEEYGLEVS